MKRKIIIVIIILCIITSLVHINVFKVEAATNKCVGNTKTTDDMYIRKVDGTVNKNRENNGLGFYDGYSQCGKDINKLSRDISSSSIRAISSKDILLTLDIYNKFFMDMGEQLNVTEFKNFEESDDYDYIYSWYATGSSKVSLANVFINDYYTLFMCYYANKENKFYYGIIGAAAMPGEDDWVGSIIISSDDFNYVCPEYNGSGISYIGTPIKDLQENIMSYVLKQEDIDTNTTDKYLTVVKNLKDDSLEFYLNINYSYINLDFSVGNPKFNISTKTNVDLNYKEFDDSYTGYYYNSNTDFSKVSYLGKGKLDVGYLLFSTEEEIANGNNFADINKESNNQKTEFIVNILHTVINKVSERYTKNDEALQDRIIRRSDYKSLFVFTIAYTYWDGMVNVLDSLAILQHYKDTQDNIYSNSDTSFKDLTNFHRMLKYISFNLGYIYDSSTYSENKWFMLDESNQAVFYNASLGWESIGPESQRNYLKDKEDKEIKTFKDIFYSLTETQRCMIASIYRSKIDLIDNKEILYKAVYIKELYDYTIKYSSKEVEKLTIQNELYNLTKDKIDNLETFTITASKWIPARLSDTLGYYILYSALTGSTQEDTGTVYNLYSPELNSLMDAMMVLQAFELEEEFTFVPMLPSNIGLLGKDGAMAMTYLTNSETPSYWDYFVKLLYTISHACIQAEASSVSDMYSSTAMKGQLDEWAESNIDPEEQTFNSKEGSAPISIGMVKMIIAIHDFCDFFKINPAEWSPEVKAFYELYPQASTYKNNQHIKGFLPGEPSNQEPMAAFFNISEQRVSEQWKKGFAVSSLYIPMQTNLYDASALSYITDSDWISEFYYKYGFYRKALYINTDNSAVINQLTSGEISGTRVATLRDLLNYNRDIILYVDTNFYNAKDVETIISKLDYSSLRNTAESGEPDKSILEGVGTWLSEIFEVDTPTVLKTAGNKYYSATLAKNATKLGNVQTWSKGVYDAYLLNEKMLFANLQDYEYSVKQSYSVVSAIYRCNELYNELLRAIASDNAIFKSSKAVASAPNAQEKDYLSILNYYMLANLEKAMKNDASSTLDLDAPIFIDVFGNILTESGIVIIPAASNATLVGSQWSPATLAFSSLYYNGNMIKENQGTESFYAWLTGDSSNGKSYINHEKAAGWFTKSGSNYILKTSLISSTEFSTVIQWDTISKNSAIIKDLFYTRTLNETADSIYSPKIANMIIEVLRGAPIENIDYTYEGLDGNRSISKFGVYMAYKLEELVTNLISGSNGNSFGGNTLITMPNLAFVSGIEYVVLYVYKIMFAVMIIGLIIQLYLDAVANSLGIRSIVKFCLTCLMVIVSLTLVPSLISWSYYKSNKDLLNEEVGYISMLNYTKLFDGAEIGVTSIETPETETELYLKLQDISVDWWTIISEVLFNNTMRTVTELYSNQISDSLIAQQKGVIQKADGLYLSVNDILDSTTIAYKPGSKKLELLNYSSDGNVTSYVIPYYVILKQLITNINDYNVANNIETYNYSIGSNGHVITYDVVSAYLKSDSFMADGYDILGLHKNVFNDDSGLVPISNPFSERDVENMSYSLWWTDKHKDTVEKNVDSLYLYARNWVAENKEILGKVPDEVYVKIFALQLAIKYNQLFSIPAGQSLEIMNIDSRDLMRMMVGDKANVYKYYSYSFSRYVYEESGTLGVIFAALFTVMLWLTSFLKPAVMILIVVLLIINILGRKLLFKKQSQCIEGYLIACGLLVLCNYTYSLMLKATISLADLGLGTVVTFCVGFIVQVAYIASLVFIMSVEIKDWKNSGFNEFSILGSSIISNMNKTQQLIVNKLVAKTNEAYRDSTSKNNYISSTQNGSELLETMHERDREREEKIYWSSEG